MEFRKMVTITLYPRQQKRHWCIEQSFGLRGRGRGWDDMGQWHWNMYNIIYETSCQSRFDARYWILGAGALGRPRGMVQGRRREEGSGWETRVYLWRIHVDIWQNQYNIVKFKKKTGVGCHFFLQCMKVKSEREVALSCPTLSDHVDYSLPGSSVHGCFQARVLEWVTITFSVFQLKSLLFFLLSSW